MPTFLYEVFSQEGKLVSGTQAAASKAQLKSNLEANGLIVQSIRRKFNFHLFSPRGVSSTLLLLFINELLVMLRSGMSIQESLKIIVEGKGFPDIDHVLRTVLVDTGGGSDLSAACAKFPQVFDSFFVRTIKIGEKTGDIVYTLNNYHSFLQHRIKVKNETLQALAYPAFLLITMTTIVMVLLMFVMPRFMSLYEGFDAELPFLTQLLIEIVDYFYIYAPIFFVVLVVLFFSVKRVCRGQRGAGVCRNIGFKVPLIGSIYRYMLIAQASRTLASLLMAGVPIVEALKNTSESIENKVVSYDLEECGRLVSEGNSFASALDQTGFFPMLAKRMIRAGEKSGSLDEMLAAIAEHYEDLVTNQLRRLVSLIEPLLVLFMGLFIGVIIVIMYLPIIHMSEIIR